MYRLWRRYCAKVHILCCTLDERMGREDNVVIHYLFSYTCGWIDYDDESMLIKLHMLSRK